MDGWVEGWESRVKDCLQQSKIKFLIISKINFNEGLNYNKAKMVRFLKIKFLNILKLNFNGGQFYKK